MRHAKVRPVIMSHEWPSDKSSADDYEVPLQLQPAGDWEENYASGRRDRLHGSDFWHARRAFLKSYQFSEQNGFKEKLKRWAKELSEVANGVASDIRQQMSRRRLGMRAYRLTLALPSRLLLQTLRCLTPWLSKKECLP
jgi:hypothetical protein